MLTSGKKVMVYRGFLVGLSVCLMTDYWNVLERNFYEFRTMYRQALSHKKY